MEVGGSSQLSNPAPVTYFVSMQLWNFPKPGINQAPVFKCWSMCGEYFLFKSSQCSIRIFMKLFAIGYFAPTLLIIIFHDTPIVKNILSGFIFVFYIKKHGDNFSFLDKKLLYSILCCFYPNHVCIHGHPRNWCFWEII